MTTQIISKLAPKNDGSFPTHSDVHGEGGFQVRTNITDRNNIPSANRKEGMWVKVQSDGKVYSLVGGITNSDWQEVVFGGGSSLYTIVNDLTARDAIASIDRTQGMLVHVLSDNRTYILNNGIANTDWMVRIYDGYSTQNDWYIDPVTGNDQNTGLNSGEPLKTFREFSRRMNGVLKQRTFCFIMNNLPSTDPLTTTLRVEWDKVLSPSQPPELLISGLEGTPIFSSTVTTATNATPASNLSPTIQDTTVANWNTYLNKTIKITSGSSQNAISWIALNLGSNTARVPEWIDSTTFSGGTVGAPSASDDYSIYNQVEVASNPDITLIGGSGSLAGDTPSVLIRNLKFTAGQVTLKGSSTVFQQCELNGVFTNSPYTFTFISCRISGACTSTTYTNTTVNLIFRGCLFNSQLASTGQVTVFNSIFEAGGSVGVIQGKYTLVNTGLFNGDGIIIQQLGTLVGNNVYGTGNSFGISIKDSDLMYNNMYITGTQELDVDGSTSFLPGLSASAGGSLPAISQCVTWAELAAAPFNGRLINYDTATRIVPAV